MATTFKKIRSHLIRLKYKRLVSLPVVVLLYFVFLDEFSETYMLKLSSTILSQDGWALKDTVFLLFIILQIVFSPLQSGFSDFFLRKKSILVSLSATLAAVILFKLPLSLGIFFQSLPLFIKGMLGNTVPIAWAAIADEAKGKNTRFYLALSICALAIGSWGSLLAMPFINTIFPALALILGIIAASLYSDKEDKADRNIAKKNAFSGIKTGSSGNKRLTYSDAICKESKGLYLLGKKILNLLILNSFIFSEISFYQILFRIEIFKNYYCFSQVPIAIGLGYTVGTVILGFIKLSNRVVSAIGLCLSVVSILGIYLLFSIGNEQNYMFIILFSLYSLGYAFFTPSIFSIMTEREPVHTRGKGFGLLESSDKIATLATFLIAFATRRISCLSVIIISLLSLLISMSLFYFVFKMDKKHQHGLE